MASTHRTPTQSNSQPHPQHAGDRREIGTKDAQLRPATLAELAAPERGARTLAELERLVPEIVGRPKDEPPVPAPAGGDLKAAFLDVGAVLAAAIAENAPAASRSRELAAEVGAALGRVAEQLLTDSGAARSWRKGLQEEINRSELGPSWSRRVPRSARNALRVKVREVPLPGGLQAPTPDLDLALDLDRRLAKLKAALPDRERQLLRALCADPDAGSQDLAAALGCERSTARTFLQRLRRRAAGL